MRELKTCVVCDSPRLQLVLDLGVHPLANSLLDSPDEEIPSYPLAVNRCEDCEHSQLTVAIEPDEMFRDYCYVSGTSQTMRNHFREFVESTTTNQPMRVLDIACNDGTLLEEFVKRGHLAQGVDPAINLASSCREKGLPVTTAYWSREVAKSLGLFNLITAFNVLAHTADPVSFLIACADALDIDGKIVIQTSQVDWLEKLQFDCVYHEHISYFSEPSIRRLAARCGLVVSSVERISLHGTSMRVTLKALYQSLRLSMDSKGSLLRQTITNLRNDGWTVCGFGAAAKGNTLLETAQCTLDWIADENPLKCGRYTPGQKTQILNADSIIKPDRLAVVVLAWNLADEIKAKVLERRTGKQTCFVEVTSTVLI